MDSRARDAYQGAQVQRGPDRALGSAVGTHPVAWYCINGHSVSIREGAKCGRVVPTVVLGASRSHFSQTELNLSLNGRNPLLRFISARGLKLPRFSRHGHQLDERSSGCDKEVHVDTFTEEAPPPQIQGVKRRSTTQVPPRIQTFLWAASSSDFAEGPWWSSGDRPEQTPWRGKHSFRGDPDGIHGDWCSGRVAVGKCAVVSPFRATTIKRASAHEGAHLG